MVNKYSAIGRILCACLAWLSIVGAASATLPIATRILTDPLTGFAAAGFDPVAYFAEGTPLQGKASIEANWQDAAWRFSNEGNRAAFLAHPEVYAPMFGGYCTVAVARGYLAEGDPTVWVIHEERLYFFHSEANRQVFLRESDLLIVEAEANWRR